MTKPQRIALFFLAFAIIALGAFDKGPATSLAAPAMASAAGAGGQMAYTKDVANKMKRPTLAEMKAAAARAKAQRDSASGGKAISNAVPPPIAASAWARRLVGANPKGRPLMKTEAVKPAMSQVTPPPTPTTDHDRSTPSSSRRRQRRSMFARVLAPSPAPTSTRSRPSRSAPWSRLTFGSTSSTARPGPAYRPMSASDPPNRIRVEPAPVSSLISLNGGPP